MPLSDYTTAELGLMLLKHQERRVILTQFKLREIREEIARRKTEELPVNLPDIGIPHKR